MNFLTILLGIVLIGLLALECVKLVRTMRDLRRKKADPKPQSVDAKLGSEPEKSDKEVTE